MRKISLALVWHMHQPYYKDDLSGTYLLPWVRLRSTKDYARMADLAAAYPSVKQTFNLVPSLLEQIQDTARGGSDDLFLSLSRKPAGDLTGEERAFLLRWMREPSRFLRVQASPRYSELASRDEHDTFTVEDIRDLQVWYNLAWCDPAWVDRDDRLSDLKIRDRGFSEADKAALFEAQLELVGSVVERYASIAREGIAELTFSPYAHPILPLISDLGSAREAVPGIELPARPFAHPGDALAQIELGRDEFEKVLGVRPRGMWPPELAVGEEVVRIAVEAGVDWFIGDEDVLARSLSAAIERDGAGRPNHPEWLYHPWRAEREGGAVSVVFRDSKLSNAVGFDYNRMHAREAVGDFLARLRAIREQQGDDRDFLVVVALDGENPWDFYPREGHDFLNWLYEKLERAPDIDCTTVSDFLDQHPHRNQLHRLQAGSWIGASLDTWIGDPEHNAAWSLLAETRDWLQDYASRQPEAPGLEAAWREIRIVEGSDWFWWFSRRHDSGMDSIWDNQFRLHLRNVYKLLEANPPSALYRPVMQRLLAEDLRQPTGAFTPKGPSDPAWEELAGSYEVGSGFGALHKPAEEVSRLLCASDGERLYVRIDSSRSPAELDRAGVAFWLYLSSSAGGDELGPPFGTPSRPSAAADFGFEPGTVVRVGGRELVVARLNDSGTGAVAVASEEIESPLYFSIPFSVLERVSGEPLQLALVITKHGREVEHVPPTGALAVTVPRGADLAAHGNGRPLSVLIAAAEVAPFAKAGGVADVSAALARELKRQGHDARLVMPRYKQVPTDGLRPAVTGLRVPLGDQAVECSILEGSLYGVPVYFVDCPQLYDRDGIYGFGDDDARFIYLSRATIEMLRRLQFVPQVIHCHDWPTALIPNLLERLYAADPEISEIATVLTLHNLAFQGSFGPATLKLAELEGWGLIKVGVPHLDDVVNFLGRGIHFADVVNTVSERYAKEVQTPELGEGLDELLRANAHKVYGIVNGIDTELFDPASDPAIAHHYSLASPDRKALDREALRAELGLDSGAAPVLAFISRFYEQKGLDLIAQALPALTVLDLQLVVLGAGDRQYEDMFRWGSAQNRGRLAAYFGFDAGLTRRVYAGADMLMMPSRFEPCGLAQLIALRYGTIPIVRATGGLADTIQDFNPGSDVGYGFVFEPYDGWQLYGAVVRAVETHRHREVWQRLVRRAMSQDVSWARSAGQYAGLYRAAKAGHRAGLAVGRA
jgi:starch synthase